MDAELKRADLLTIEDASVYLGIPVSSIRWMYRMKRIPFTRIGRQLRTTKAALDAAIDKQLQEAVK